MNIYVDRQGIRRISEDANNSNNSVFVVSNRDAPGATVVSCYPPCYPPGVAGAFHVLRAIPFSVATVEELRKCDRVLMPRNGGKGRLLTVGMMQDAERQLSRFFDFEQLRTYGAAQ